MTEIMHCYSVSQLTLAGLAIAAAIGMAWIDRRRQLALKRCQHLGEETQRLVQSKAGMKDLVADLLGTVNLAVARGGGESPAELTGEVQRLRCAVEDALGQRDGDESGLSEHSGSHWRLG